MARCEQNVCLNLHTSRERIDATTAVAVADVPVDTLKAYVGTYELDGQGRRHFIDVALDGTDLWFDFDRTGKELLIPLSHTRFSWAGSIMEFSTSGMVIYAVEDEVHGKGRQGKCGTISLF